MHIVTTDEMYEIDRYTMEKVGLNGVSLMENAGRAIAFKAMETIDHKQRTLVLVGAGNNGGDGFVIARTLLEMGYDVDVWVIPPLYKIRGDARIHHDIFLNCGFRYFTHMDIQDLGGYEVFIDAMLGIGLQGEVRSPYKEIIQFCNASEAFKLAVDVPSGVSGDEMTQVDCAFQANRTITIQCPKISAYSYLCSRYYGEVTPVDIGIPSQAIAALAPHRRDWGEQEVLRTVEQRSRNSHKGTNGKCLLIGGSIGMPGAITMTAKAAHRSGAGLVTVAIPDDIYGAVSSHVVEATFSLWKSNGGYFSGELGEDVTTYDVIAVGPGLGRMKEGKELISALLTQVEGPLVIDADGLYHLCELKDLLRRRAAPTVITPHLGEMSRLLGIPVSELSASRFSQSVSFAKEYGIYLVLKGPSSIVVTPNGDQFVNTTGNASLAKGGSGDVLTGMISAFIAHQKEVQPAISNAVYFHGMAADELISNAHSMIDVLATDIIQSLPSVFRTVFK